MTEFNHDEYFSGLEKFSTKKLVLKDDIDKILQSVFKNNKLVELKEILFWGKYINGLLKVLRKNDNIVDDEHLQKIKKEYSDAVVRLRANLNEIIIMMETFYAEIFSEKYLSMTQNSLSSLNLLCQDLSLIKEYVNENKLFDKAANSN